MTLVLVYKMPSIPLSLKKLLSSHRIGFFSLQRGERATQHEKWVENLPPDAGPKVRLGSRPPPLTAARASALPVRRSGCRPSALCHPRARKLPRANPLSTARGSHLHAAAAARQRAAAERTAVHRRRSARRHARREQRSNGESRECEVPAASALQLPPRGSTGVGGGRRRRRRAAGGASKVRWI